MRIDTASELMDTPRRHIYTVHGLAGGLETLSALS